VREAAATLTLLVMRARETMTAVSVRMTYLLAF
jgi:hypothetical protein